MKIICYELNEVPWQVVDYFLHERPRSTLGKMLQNAYQLTTHTKDVGELHPWSTWPTVHRGVYNTTHNIRFLNQDIKDKHAPIWEMLADNGVSCGVFGSLQSWPVMRGEQYRFYVPDTFSRTSETHPSSFSVFQKFNLKYTEKEGGVVPKNLSFSSKDLQEVYRLMCAGLTIKTVCRAGWQVVREYLNPIFKTIRPIFQAPLSFDFYMKALSDTRPQFTTYFTNHVASMMHKYWKHAFPKEFKYALRGEADGFKNKNILRAMTIADEQLRRLKDFADQNGYVVMILSSMGQEAIDRGDYKGELHLSHLDVFLKMLGYSGPVRQNLAMHPDFSFEFDTQEDLEHFKILASALTRTRNDPLFTFKESGRTLNCNLQSSVDLIQQGHIFKKGEPVLFEESGFTVEDKDRGTGYHQPRGVWITYHKDLNPNAYRREVESIRVAPTILSLFDVARPSYMAAPVRDLESLRMIS